MENVHAIGAKMKLSKWKLVVLFVVAFYVFEYLDRDNSAVSLSIGSSIYVKSDAKGR